MFPLIRYIILCGAASLSSPETPDSLLFPEYLQGKKGPLSLQFFQFGPLISGQHNAIYRVRQFDTFCGVCYKCNCLGKSCSTVRLI